MVRNPAAGAVVDRSGFPAIDREFADKGKERFVALGEVGHLGGPVVHLGVDVDRIVAAPGRTHRLVPDALQVGRLAAGPGAGDQQIAAEVEQQRRQSGIGDTLGEARETSLRRQRVRAGCSPEVQHHAPVEPLVVGDVAGEQIRGGFALRGLQVAASDRDGIKPVAGG